MYGPTETTIWSSIAQVQPDEVITIGRPIANTEIYILDEGLEPVPIGVTGTLYIGGEGVSPGYLNRPELTEKKFIANPFKPGSGLKIYNTGDNTRFLPDGRIEFLGRSDKQVKIHGFRIELSEIENGLAQHPAVQKSMVLVQVGPSGQKSLVAYVIQRDKQPILTAELQAFLHEKLPEFMIPKSFVFLDAFPLNPAGKLDQKALATLVPAQVHAIIAPRNPIEHELVEIWENVLNTHPIGVEMNFFELGGFSLQAVRLLNQVENKFGINCPFVQSSSIRPSHRWQ